MDRRLKSQDLARASPTSRRETIPRAGILRKFRSAATAATFALALACGTASVVTPTTVRAEETEVKSKNANVESLKVVKLKKTLKELDKESEQYRRDEFIPNGKNGVKNYSNRLVVPGEASFLVTFEKSGSKTVIVRFPEERETNPNAEVPGARIFDLTTLEEAVKSMGLELERVDIIGIPETFMRNGEEVGYIRGYIFPKDAEDRLITNIGDGKYVSFSLTLLGDKVFAGPCIVEEPNNQTTMALARR